MSFDNDIDIMGSIEACRTCGVFSLTNSSFLRQLFTPAAEDPEMMHIRMELSSWKVEINENDGFPQFICTGCILEFQKIFQFRNSCIDIQKQLQHFYHVREQNQVQIKHELPDELEENVCDFIYVDDLSDAEYDGATPFNIPHVPIKEEHIEEAAIPVETPTTIIDTANTNADDTNVQLGIAPQEIESATLPGEIEMKAPLSAFNSHEIFDMADEPRQCLDGVIADTTEASDNSTSLQIQCELCNCVSANLQQHKIHMKHVHEIKDLECHICGKLFKNSSSTRLKFHLKWHKISKHIKCAQCGFYCNSRETLREHTRQTHSKVNCSVCGKHVFPKRMKEHLKTHGGNEDNFECSLCSQAFSSSVDLGNHRKNMHTNEEHNEIQQPDVHVSCENEILCAVCDQTFSNREELETHAQKHRGVVTNSLSTPNEENKTMYMESNDVSSENRNLMESLTLNSEEPAEFFCTKCLQKFADKNDLSQHSQECQQRTIDEISLQTPICNSFNEIKNEYLTKYENEELQHTQEESSYMNEQDCFNASVPDSNFEDDKANDQRFEEDNQFNQLHSYGCAQCTDTFESVEDLLEHHVRMHPKKSSFKCPICEKVYELKFSLNRHMRKHNI